MDYWMQMLGVGRRAARRISNHPLVVEEAAERAMHALKLAHLGGYAPQFPNAWVQIVARRAAIAQVRHGHDQGADPKDWEQPAAEDPPWDADHSATSQAHSEQVRECVRARLHPYLTQRQRDILEAAFATRSIRSAAARCGTQPNDFRRALRSIARKARFVLVVAGQWDAGHSS